jgi:hypothetical protein
MVAEDLVSDDLIAFECMRLMIPMLFAAATTAAYTAEPIGFVFENPFFIADLTARQVRGKTEDNGTLRTLIYKQAGNLKIERSKNRMHWAPSFQRTGATGYKSIGTWDPVQKHAKTETKEYVRLTRSGYEQTYPEIHLFTEYDFMKNEPYFLFRSTMTIEKPIDMYWLRNQEMTMYHIFTHAAWPGEGGKPVVMDFDARKPVLQAKPLAVDVPWIAFVNLEKGFGYGAVTLHHKATKLANAITSINDGVDPPARYWDRRLINQKDTKLEPGDKFEEETAYVLFKVGSKENPLREFLALEKKIRAKAARKK